MKKSVFFTRAGIYFFLILVALACLIPFYSMFISATHSNAEIARDLLLTPGDQFMENYHRLIDTVNIWRGFLNTTFIAVTSTILGVYFSALVGYGFAKYHFPASKGLFLFILITMMIPGQLGIIGFYKVVESLGMLNTYWPLILPSIANAFGVFYLKQSIDHSISDEIMDSARMEGCGEWKIFHRIVLPMLKPALATLSILVFIGKWNSFLEPLIVLFENDMQTLAVMVASVKSQFNIDYGAQYVAITISVIPIVIFFLFASRKIMDSVGEGALKD